MRKIKVALINPRGFDIKQYLPISLAYLKANLDDEESQMEEAKSTTKGGS